MKKSFLKKLIALAILIMTAFSISGCGTKAEPAAENKPVKIVFWYAVGGKVGEATKTLVDEFNACPFESATHIFKRPWIWLPCSAFKVRNSLRGSFACL